MVLDGHWTGSTNAGVGLAGEADGLENAKVALRQAFNAVLYWAAEHNGGLLPWHGMDQVQG